MTLQERFLALRRVDPMDSLPGEGEPEREHVTLRADPGQINPHLTKIDFSLGTRCVFLGNEDLQRCLAGLVLDPGPAGLHILAHRRIRNLCPVFIDEAVEDPLGGMPLLPRRHQILLQHFVNGGLEPVQLRGGPDRGLSARWLC